MKPAQKDVTKKTGETRKKQITLQKFVELKDLLCSTKVRSL